MTRTALYPGSFDPVTNGHMDVLRQTLCIADRIVVAIGVHHEKSANLSYEQRADMVKSGISDEFSVEDGAKITVESFSGLVVDSARKHGAGMIVRGLRDGTDLDYEMQMVGMNASLAPDIQTVFVPASMEVRHISASLVRQIANMGGEISAFVPDVVVKHYNSGKTTT